jgi:DNA ligase-1
MKQTIYKKDTKGKIRIISFEAKDGTIVRQTGLLNGKLIENVTVCHPKNVGRKNATTAQEQAEAEIKSLMKAKLEEGYFETIEQASTIEFISPMLAKEYSKEKHKIEYPCYVQPKLDGMRCLKNKTVLTSRENKVIDTLPHIQKELDSLRTLLDGELYAHGKSFQENMSLIKKNTEESSLIKFHVYDLVMTNTCFRDRYNLLKYYVEDCEHIELVPTYRINSEEELKKYHAQFLAEGYEGTMIRHGDEGYKVNGRSSNLLKYKDFLDIACKIVGVRPSSRRPTQGNFICELPDGKQFKTGMKYSNAEREEILTNKNTYIGLTAEIRFFEYTDDGIPRFPVCVGTRLDK